MKCKPAPVRTLIRALALILALGTTAQVRSDGPSTNRAPAFALIGDIPYFALEVPMIDRIFASLDEDIAFVIHVGDLKASWERCSDRLLAERHALLDRSPVPLVFTPGDNEWADCHRLAAGGFDPIERLAALRGLFFSGTNALGAGADAGRLHLERQADPVPGGTPENLRWRAGTVLFLTINLPGSRNAQEVENRHPGSRATRERWNEAWMREAFAIAARENLDAVVVVGHANPNFGRRAGTPYAGFQRLLKDLSANFAGQTLFLHGDTHHHEIERLGERFHRVESYGSPFSDSWLRIELDPYGIAAEHGTRSSRAGIFRVTSRRTDRDPPLP